MANTENIEAKLCAYIDGDLDAQGRAEIEKHLANNPQHRTLIDQLSRQRDLLRTLPRENAPEEILDALQSDMERSVLLGDDDAGEAETLKISRWPQVFAAAAIVLLTVGLGAVIYFVLPRNGGGGNVVAIGGATSSVDLDTRTSTTTDDERFARESAEASARAEDKSSDAFDALGARARAVEPSIGKSAPPAASEVATAPPTVALKGGLGAESEDKQSADVFAPSRIGGAIEANALAMNDLRAAQDRLNSADLARQLKDAPGGALKENAMFVVVATADPVGTRQQVADYLGSNKISWDEVAQPQPAPLEVADDQSVNLMRQQRTDVRMKTGSVDQQGQQQPSVSPTPMKTEVAKSAGGGGSGAQALAGGAAKEDAEQQQSLGVQSGPSPVQQQREVQQQAAAPQVREDDAKQQQVAVQAPAAPATPPAPSGVASAGERSRVSPDASVSNMAIPDAGLTEVTEQPQHQQAQQYKPFAGGLQSQLVSGKDLIIARGMTKRQAEELRGSLSKQTTVQRAAVYEQRALNVLPTPQPTQPMAQSSGLPTTLPSAAPALDAAAGADRLVTNTAPASQPTAAAVFAEAPATQPAVAIAPTTVPTQSGSVDGVVVLNADLDASSVVSATAPAEERVDVVILLQDDIAPASDVANMPPHPSHTQVPATAGPAPNDGPTTAPAAEAAPATQPAPPAAATP